MAKIDKLRETVAKHGEERGHALKAADRELDAIAELAPAAIKAGMTISELARLGNVSRPTLYAKLR